MKRGEVWWAEPPDETPRPVLILTRNAAIEVMERVLVAPLTTTIRSIPTEVPLDRSDGVPLACVASLDDIAPVSKDYLIEHLATLTPTRMAEVAKAIRRATGC